MFASLENIMYILIIVILSSLCSGIKQPLRVYGGENVDKEAYPYVVRLESRYKIKMANGSVLDKHYHRCTASALSSTWALTAAHCITELNIHPKGFQPVRLVLRYGSVHSLPNDKNTFSDVVLVIPHPMYVYRKSMQEFVVKNDIGVIKTNPMPLKKYIKLSPLDFNTMFGHEAIFGGFGMTTKKISNNEAKIDDTLELKKQLQIFKVLINKCMKYSRSGPHLCLGHRCGSIATTCRGDSGGPVIHPSGIVAVLSSSYVHKYCGEETQDINNDNSGFTCPVGPYVEWIASYVRN